MHTEGFTRQRLNHLSEVPATDGSGGGVRSGTIKRVFDRFTQRKIIQERPHNGLYDARENFLAKVEVIFNEEFFASIKMLDNIGKVFLFSITPWQ